MNHQDHVSLHRKRFGQYFSGDKVAELLAVLLPENGEITSAVDPMAGTGDLLAVIEQRIDPEGTILGVEIDKSVAEQCTEKLSNVRIINQDAFCCEDLITEDGWDLVITNPPYVRYQLQNEDETVMPSGKTIRRNLLKQLAKISYMSSKQKELYVNIAKRYSGLSDMAVPSWILCAALVKPGGILAIVVPETWLNREYAKPVQYLLMKNFDTITVAKDINACWFDHVLVRTCLVVAQKRELVPLCTAYHKQTFLLDLGKELAGEKSLVEHLSFDGASSYDALAKILRRHSGCSGTGYTAKMENTSALFPNMLNDGRSVSWIMSEDRREAARRTVLPADLSQLLDAETASFCSLSELGISCGQGLRTGANDFFYLTITGETDEDYFVRPKTWYKKEFKISKKYMIKTFQNRREASGIVISPDELSTGLLKITDEIRPEDFKKCDAAVIDAFGTLQDDVTDYINAAEGLSFKEFSAVKPNERRGEDGYLRFWYMLPPLTRRHLPDLCITRVSASASECLYIPQSESEPTAVDANFVTLWCDSDKRIPACMALLNSSWCKCYMELLCTVMGGGALKIEAGHMRNLLFPKLSEDQVHRLSECGLRLMSGERPDKGLQNAIDQIIMDSFSGGKILLEKIKNLLDRKLSERGVKQSGS